MGYGTGVRTANLKIKVTSPWRRFGASPQVFFYKLKSLEFVDMYLFIYMVFCLRTVYLKLILVSRGAYCDRAYCYIVRLSIHFETWRGSMPSLNPARQHFPKTFRFFGTRWPRLELQCISAVITISLISNPSLGLAWGHSFSDY